MGNIVLLDDLTINKIAAGEVIERPASVVKELMENSIDAGATSVTVEIKNGGISYIRITDNGKGFLPDDMEIAFERHATSKIRSAKDLEVVKSMGFRGEALASIAAIARVELTSRTADSEIGYRIVVEGGKIISKEETGCPKGTTIIVENLFFNTPVRYKFLKKDFTELGYVEDAVTRLALVNTNVAVKLVSLGKTMLQTTGNGKLKDTVYSIYGKEIAENIIDVDYKLEDMAVSGCVGKAEIAKSNRASQLFFVNGRFVKDKILSSATEQALRGIMPDGKYGFLILNLDIDPHQIDVNVHPAKLEIRFQEENKIFKLIYHAIKEAFIQEEQKNNNQKKKEEEPDILELIKEGCNTKIDREELEKQKQFIYSTPVKDNGEKSDDKHNVIEEVYRDKIMEKSVENHEISNIENSGNQNRTSIFDESDEKFSENIIDKDIDEAIEKRETDKKESEKDLSLELDKSFEEMYRKTFGKAPVEEKPVVKEKEEKYDKDDIDVSTAENVSSIESRSIFNKVRYKFIGFAFKDYAVIEIDRMMYIIDGQYANERVLYEKIRRGSNKDSQVMLLPDIIELSTKEMDIARDNMELFKNAGFDVEEFGENTVKLNGVPGICMSLDNKELFKNILEEINTVARTSKDEIQDKFAATVAKKAAVKMNIPVTFEEVDALMQQLLVLENPFVSPNGNAIAIKLSQSEIEKKFSKK